MQSASAEILARAAVCVDVRDAEGRVLSLRRISALDRLHLFKALGAVLSQNTAYLGMATLAFSVTAIDGVPVPAAANETQIEALVSRLGDAGIAAAATALRQSVEVETDPGN